MKNPELSADKDLLRQAAIKAKQQKPVICYPTDTLPTLDFNLIDEARASLKLMESIDVPPREARCFKIKEGYFFRIVCSEGPQVGDLNLWARENIKEHFYSGKTRALHGTHLSTGDRLWSCFPYLRPIATIVRDTLDWYGWDEYGASVHDVIGTRCDPYTAKLLSGEDYHHCCHSNLIRAFSEIQSLTCEQAEVYVHDVLNIFMCTGFTQDTHQYFMRSSPVRKGDYLEFMAEIDLIGGLSACPGGDCSVGHSSDAATCYPLKVEILKSETPYYRNQPSISDYNRQHKEQNQKNTLINKYII